MIVSARACGCVCGCACVYFRITLYANLLTELFSMVPIEMKKVVKKEITNLLQKERRKLFNTFHIVSRGNDIFVLNPFENETTVSFYTTSYNSRGEESRVKVLKCSASANVRPGPQKNASMCFAIPNVANLFPETLYKLLCTFFPRPHFFLTFVHSPTFELIKLAASLERNICILFYEYMADLQENLIGGDDQNKACV